jgi:hypothetical protein
VRSAGRSSSRHMDATSDLQFMSQAAGIAVTMNHLTHSESAQPAGESDIARRTTASCTPYDCRAPGRPINSSLHAMAACERWRQSCGHRRLDVRSRLVHRSDRLPVVVRVGGVLPLCSGWLRTVTVSWFDVGWRRQWLACSRRLIQSVQAEVDRYRQLNRSDNRARHKHKRRHKRPHACR